MIIQGYDLKNLPSSDLLGIADRLFEKELLTVADIQLAEHVIPQLETRGMQHNPLWQRIRKITKPHNT